MIAKSPLVSLLAASSLAGNALAANSFRHNQMHRRSPGQKLDIRGIHTEWVVVEETKFVYANGAEHTVDAVKAQDYDYAPTTTTTTTIPAAATTTSTSTSTVISTTGKFIPVVEPFTLNPTSSSSAPAYGYNAEEVAQSSTSSTPAEAVYAAAGTTLSTLTTVAAGAAYVADSTSSASAASTSTSSSTGSSSKRGLAYNDGTLLDTFFNQRTFDWSYNWGAYVGDVSVDIEFVPMLWGNDVKYTNDWTTAADKAISSGSTHVLSFNEPDILSQSNMDVSVALAAHIAHVVPLKSKAKIGSPATSNSNLDGEGNVWLKSFMTACEASSECVVDFCVTHWYAEASAADTLFTHLEAVHEICGDRKIWLTEFAPTGAGDDAAAFLAEVLPKLDALDYLERYSYFFAAIPNMFISKGVLNEAGSAYM
ncbi:hypothetical protein BROUX41_005169 [Berkeleyomyces rouxiae]|uniref:uncharacterized protein n=1 Tax=Berkeleyomyces rouxiae TaxID=2035830 RepID=UPI003B76E988